MESAPAPCPRQLIDQYKHDTATAALSHSMLMLNLAVSVVVAALFARLRLTLCVDRIVDDLGSAFSMGCLGGAAWHGIKGMKNSPRGARLRGGYNTIILRAPTLGGNFAVWGGLFSAYDCAFIHLRGKEDPWNAIAAGACTGGTLALRHGTKSIGKNAIIGGVLLAIIEGLSMMATKMMIPEQPPMTMTPVVHTLPPPTGIGQGVGGITLDHPSTPAMSSVPSAAALYTQPMSSTTLSPPSSTSSWTPRPEEEFTTDDFSFDDSKDFLEEM